MFFPAADPDTKIISGLQLRLVRSSTLPGAPSPPVFSKVSCSRCGSIHSSGGSSSSSRNSRSSSTRSSSSSSSGSSSSRHSSGSRLGAARRQTRQAPAKTLLIGGSASHLNSNRGNFGLGYDVGGGGGVEPLGETSPLQPKILVPKNFSLEQRAASKHSLDSWLPDFAHFDKQRPAP